MTSKELSQIYYLKKEIRYLEDTLNELRAKAEKITTSFSAVRGGSSYGDKIAALVVKMDELEQKIYSKKTDCVLEQLKIERYLDEIDNSFIRQIFRYRHINCFTWNKIAFIVGGGNTADSLRMIHDRYIKTH